MIAETLASKSVPEPNTGCLLWVGASNDDGYGRVHIGADKFIRAHRASWEVTHGPIPAGLFVCHRCDTPACINPDHLFLGTLADNAADMKRKGRARNRPAPGESNGRAKLSWETARRIRGLKGAKSQHELAREFNISRSSIKFILQGRTWKEAA